MCHARLVLQGCNAEVFDGIKNALKVIVTEAAFRIAEVPPWLLCGDVPAL